jgi:CHASE2 domain-containing sensor protein
MNHGPPSEGAAPLGGHAGRSRWFARAGVPLSALLLTLLLAVTPGAARVQRGIDDMLLGLAAAPLAAPSVLVVDLDEDSIRRLKPAFGAWPFRRDAYALVIDYLREAGARAVVIGVVLADERDGDAALQPGARRHKPMARPARRPWPSRPAPPRPSMPRRSSGPIGCCRPRRFRHSMSDS